jgi:hypothetical protein
MLRSDDLALLLHEWESNIVSIVGAVKKMKSCSVISALKFWTFSVHFNSIDGHALHTHKSVEGLKISTYFLISFLGLPLGSLLLYKRMREGVKNVCCNYLNPGPSN